MPSWGEVLDWINTLEQEQGADAYDIAINHYLRQVNQYRSRDTIVYTTDWTQPSASGHNQNIGLGDMQGFMEVMSGLDGGELDLILHSPGGSPEAAEQIIAYLREQYDHICMFVPEAAKSAATLMCCAADKVVMGDHSSLGPIDPQMIVPKSSGVHQSPAYSILDQFDKAREEYRRTGEVGAWGPILTQYGPSLLAECEDAIELSEELAREWLSEYMLTEEDVEQNVHEWLAEHLANRDNFRSHSRPIPRKKASRLGFDVEALEEDDELQDRILSVHHATSILMDKTQVSKIISSHEGDRYACFAPAPDDNISDGDSEEE
jgi:hypothetical protein